MENLDSTVIATSLPAIAKDLHEDPISLKLLSPPTRFARDFHSGERLAADRSVPAKSPDCHSCLHLADFMRHGGDLAGIYRRPRHPRPRRPMMFRSGGFCCCVPSNAPNS